MEKEPEYGNARIRRPARRSPPSSPADGRVPTHCGPKLALGPDGRVPGTCHEPCYPARSMAYPQHEQDGARRFVLAPSVPAAERVGVASPSEEQVRQPRAINAAISAHRLPPRTVVGHARSVVCSPPHVNASLIAWTTWSRTSIWTSTDRPPSSASASAAWIIMVANSSSLTSDVA